jgi:hypothetical protein
MNLLPTQGFGKTLSEHYLNINTNLRSEFGQFLGLVSDDDKLELSLIPCPDWIAVSRKNHLNKSLFQPP